MSFSRSRRRLAGLIAVAAVYYYMVHGRYPKAKAPVVSAAEGTQPA